MDNKRTLLMVLFFTLFMLFIVIFANFYITKAEDRKIYYLSDLHEGDFIPNGSLLIMDTYFYSSSFFPNGQDYVRLDFRTETYSGKEDSYSLGYNSSYEVPAWDGYDGWTFKSCSLGVADFIASEKLASGETELQENPVVQAPNKENEYKLVLNESNVKNIAPD